MSDSVRPAQVTTALALFTATLVMGLIKLGRTLTLTVAPASQSSFMIFTFIAIYALIALLTVYIGLRAAWARGAMVVLTLVGILPGLILVFSHFSLMPVLASLTCGQVAAQAIGLYLVYREPAASWFGRPLT